MARQPGPGARPQRPLQQQQAPQGHQQGLYDPAQHPYPDQQADPHAQHGQYDARQYGAGQAPQQPQYDPRYYAPQGQPGYSDQGYPHDGQGEPYPQPAHDPYQQVDQYQQHQSADPYRQPQAPADPLGGGGHAHNPYGQPSPQGHEVYSASGAPSQPSPYAPQFDPYLPQQQAEQPHADPFGPQGQPQPGYPDNSAYAAQNGQQPVAPREPALRGPSFDDWPDQSQAAGHPQPGAYGQPSYAGADQFAAPGPERGYVPPNQGQSHGYHGSFSGPAGQAPQELYDGYEEEYDDAYDEPEEEPRSSSRMFLIAGALVGALAVGGGAAYVYKAMLGPAANADGKPPIVTSEVEPNKIRPENPGGRKFDHTDSKIMERLGGGSSTRQEASGTNPDGSRRVSTMVIGRDGSVQPPSSPPVPSGAAPVNPVVSVPGLTVVDAFAGARQQAAAQRPSSSAAGGPIVVRPPAAEARKPIVITSPPTGTPPATKPKTAAPAAKPPATKSPAAKPPPRKTAALPTQTRAASTAAPPARSGGGNGYVAVLASVPVSGTSQMDSLKAFADIQQRYPTVLRDKTPEVREANLGAKGRYHRLLVGPPSSRGQASQLCQNLKSAGYSSCWVTSF